LIIPGDSPKTIPLTCTCGEVTGTCLLCCLRRISAGRADADLLLASPGQRSPWEVRRRLKAIATQLVGQWRILSFTDDLLTVDLTVASLSTARRVALLSATPGAVADLRDRAMLLLAWHLGLRGDEVCRRLRRRDVKVAPAGIAVTIPDSKGDQNGIGRDLGLRPTRDPLLCGVSALSDWLDVSDAASADPDRPLFCRVACWRAGLATSQPLSVARWREILFTTASEAGIELHISTRSAREGFAATAIDQGATVEQVQHVLGQKRPEMTLLYLANAGDRTRQTTARVLGGSR
jgi:integrase